MNDPQSSRSDIFKVHSARPIHSWCAPDLGAIVHLRFAQVNVRAIPIVDSVAALSLSVQNVLARVREHRATAKKNHGCTMQQIALEFHNSVSRLESGHSNIYGSIILEKIWISVSIVLLQHLVLRWATVIHRTCNVQRAGESAIKIDAVHITEGGIGRRAARSRSKRMVVSLTVQGLNLTESALAIRFSPIQSRGDRGVFDPLRRSFADGSNVLQQNSNAIVSEECLMSHNPIIPLVVPKVGQISPMLVYVPHSRFKDS
mmetsp:Transcript_20274/g.49297  ORF Transcript_20274/g.49297 Transcript_20274/m.49297 type:complete len:259 (-) Transcript_20274:124-900(-)